MNIRSRAEKDHKARFLDTTKAKAVRRKNEELRERQGKRVVKLHENFGDLVIPQADELKAMVREYHQEHGAVPNTLLVHKNTKTKTVILYLPDIITKSTGCLSLRVEQSEFCGLEYRA